MATAWRPTAIGGCALMVALMAARSIGLAPQDVLLVLAVGAYATVERWRGGSSADSGGSLLLGEDAAAGGVQLLWWDFACEHHQLLGCFVRGKRHNRRGRAERFLSLAVSTLAMLYWRAIFRPPLVRMQSLRGLASSIWTLLISKGVQQLIKLGIRIFAGRQAAWQASAGWLDALQLQWQISQYWTLGFMMLCVLLALLEGRNWFHLLAGWLVSMGFALVFLDLAFTYIKFKLLTAWLLRRRRRRSSAL